MLNADLDNVIPLPLLQLVHRNIDEGLSRCKANRALEIIVRLKKRVRLWEHLLRY